MTAAPIGAFDSGVGGLSVLREIRRQMPAEDLIYVADSGNAPYGEKPAEFVRARSETICRFLVEQGVKAIVVACNTATGIAVEDLRTQFAVPIVAIEPAVKPAASGTRSGRVAVLATAHTLSSRKFLTLVADHARNAEVLPQACPGLVEQVEAGDFSGPATRALVESYVRPLLEQGVDTVVLGCTHYSFLAPTIAEVCGPGVTILDPAPAVASELQRRLSARGLLASGAQAGSETIFTTGSIEGTRAVLALLWPGDAKIHGAGETAGARL